jgi:cytochrome c-type biogenesis protein CcmH
MREAGRFPLPPAGRDGDTLSLWERVRAERGGEGRTFSGEGSLRKGEGAVPLTSALHADPPHPQPLPARGREWGRIFAAALLLALTAPALAVQPDEVLKDPALEHRARDISAGLRCLVCQNQSIDDSEAPLAKDLRVLVRERLKAGESDDQVRDFVVRRYGEFVLLKPTFGAHTALLWLGPALVLLTGATGLALALRRRRTGSAVSALSPEERAALDAILDRNRAS